ncbi:YqaJ viral recombinase family protein [Desulfovibrio intestinalis]|uniref:Putative phage-type endonuclease n=1 Tax=Desulfovibrio intestinalis TaxID=58621 RepID=A0A7W8C1I9_9BACT|nr:YqaJ viral recombinase family protein [Desulfovibrio intestinalis]MBB5143920.1 putative phage-type endonuclease [Desulfovibrio intestinalis]
MTRSEWLALRRSGLGGSDMPSVLGVCPYGGTPLGVWRSKVLGAQDTEPSADMQRGNFLEPIIRDLYVKKTGFQVQLPTLQRHSIETWAIANLDGLIIPNLPQLPGVLEIKAPRLGKFIAFEEYGVPANYQIQVQHYMGVTGLEWADFCAWNADAFRLLIVRIERDNALIRLMWEAGREFWERHVLTGIPPDAGSAPMVKLSSLSPTVCKMDSPEWMMAAGVWREAKNILKEAEAYEGSCREQLVKMAIETGKAKARGFDVSVSIDKNGVPRVRDNMKEQAA